MTTFDDLTFAALSAVNRSRVERWHPGFPADGWTGSDWSNAAAGEMGEACNIVKKLRRAEAAQPAALDPAPADLVGMLATEIADTIIYLDLLAQYYNIHLPAAIVDKFNFVSEREGFPERLPGGPGEVRDA